MSFFSTTNNKKNPSFRNNALEFALLSDFFENFVDDQQMPLALRLFFHDVALDLLEDLAPLHKLDHKRVFLQL